MNIVNALLWGKLAGKNRMTLNKSAETLAETSRTWQIEGNALKVEITALFTSSILANAEASARFFAGPSVSADGHPVFPAGTYKIGVTIGVVETSGVVLRFRYGTNPLFDVPNNTEFTFTDAAEFRSIANGSSISFSQGDAYTISGLYVRPASDSSFASGLAFFMPDIVHEGG